MPPRCWNQLRLEGVFLGHPVLMTTFRSVDESNVFKVMALVQCSTVPVIGKHLLI